MGLSLHYFADMFFNKPHIGTNTNFSLTLYGQVNGGTGWGSVYTDKDIHERIKQGITPEELNRFIYKKAIKLFVAQPVNFIKASIETYKNYIKTIPADFRRNGRIGPFFFILIFSVFYILFLDGRQKGVLKNLYVKEKILFLAGIIFFFFAYHVFWTFFLIVGTICVLKNLNKPENVFIALYALGIFFSLPFLGDDGGERAKVSNDILLYFIAALACGQVSNDFRINKNEPWDDKDIVRSPQKRWIALIGIFAFVIFLAIPFAINRYSKNRLCVKQPDIIPQEIIKSLNVHERVITDTDLGLLSHDWPEPSFEKINKMQVLTTFKYRAQDAIFFNSGDGVVNPEREGQFWPLFPVNFPRTINATYWIIFPDLNPAELKQFDGKTIVVLGSLISHTQGIALPALKTK